MFDKEKFGNIINLIVTKGYNDNNAEFARTINLDRTYISKWINKRLSSAPTPKVLEKIAHGSKGLTTYNDLMQICGYITLDGIYDLALNEAELSTVNEMLIDYKNFLNNKHTTFSKFNEQKYLKNFSDKSKDKILIAFRRNSLNIIFDNNSAKTLDDNEFQFVSEDDAMFPLLDIGDVATIFKQNEIDNILTKNKGTYLINLDNQNTIRKIVLNDDENSYSLIAMNACYKIITIPKNTIYEQIQIIGKVVKVENSSAFK